MKIFGRKFLLACFLSCCFLPFSSAQVQDKETQNLVTNPLFSGTNGWSISGYTAGTPQGQFVFSYVAGIVTQSINVGNALNAQSLNLPLSVVGIRYGWSYSIWCNNSIGGYCENPKGPVDKLTAGITVYGNNDSEIYKKSYTYNTYDPEWKYENTTVKFNRTYESNELNRIVFSFTGKDEGYWAGFYGPKVTAVHARLIYQPNICSVDPSLDITCPGYAESVFNKQCTNNPLSSPQCTGYNEAYMTQQCSANSLYNAMCPGYQQAYFTQQCTINPMYNVSCPGFEQARLAQVCAINPLNDNRCPGFQQAYFQKQCKDNPLSNPSCEGYKEAFLALQCSTNALYSPYCPLYESTFLKQQCDSNPLYSTLCVGYADARKQQLEDNLCSANPQSSSKCPGYKQPTIVQPSTPSIGTEDPVKLLTIPQITNDPFVNQVISRELSGEATKQTEQPLQQRPTRQTQVAAQKKKEEEQRQQVSRSQAGTQRQAQQRRESTPQEVAIANIAPENPAFLNYQSSNIPDLPFYKPEDIYKRVTIQDNVRALRQLNQRSDRVHKEMVDEQYRD